MISGWAITAHPGKLACAMANNDQHHSADQKQLIQAARRRIENKYGAMQSKPVIHFFDNTAAFWPLKVNNYGSTNFLIFKTCVALGPHGQNIDVTAHELMHAETEHRLGFWRRWTELPTWFDEGLAMQVDHRSDYDLPAETDSSFVRRLKTGKQFYVHNDQQLTHHYAAAKLEVTKWLSKTDSKLVYNALSKIKSGEDFEAIWANR